MVTLSTIRVGDEFIDKGGGRERVWRKGGRRGCRGREIERSRGGKVKAACG